MLDMNSQENAKNTQQKFHSFLKSASQKTRAFGELFTSHGIIINNEVKHCKVLLGHSINMLGLYSWIRKIIIILGFPFSFVDFYHSREDLSRVL